MEEEDSYTIEELVSASVDCIDKTVDGFRLSGSDNLLEWRRVFPILVEELIEDNKKSVRIDLNNFRISEQEFKSELKSFLSQIKEKDSPGNYFIDNIGDFKKKNRYFGQK